MSPLSVAIITFNEEENIERCIKSVWTIADEILIVDSFSTDKTKEIALTYPKVRFIENPFEGHIQQKNFALQNTTYDWVLSLDADEELSDELRLSITLLDDNPTIKAYSFNRKNNYCGTWIQHSGWYPDTKVRLVHKGFAHWGGENPHDQLLIKDGEEIQHLTGDLFHYTFKTVEQHLAQIEKFTSIAAQVAYEKGKRSNKIVASIHAAGKFIKSYFIKRGFLDGKIGYQICKLSAKASYLKYIKLSQLHKNGGK